MLTQSPFSGWSMVCQQAPASGCRIAIVAAVFMLAFVGTGLAEPCNPVIDGTYCASLPKRSQTPSSPTPVQLQPIQSIARDVLGDSQTATLGRITFQGAATCIGTIRRAACR